MFFNRLVKSTAVAATLIALSACGGNGNTPAPLNGGTAAIPSVVQATPTPAAGSTVAPGIIGAVATPGSGATKAPTITVPVTGPTSAAAPTAAPALTPAPVVTTAPTAAPISFTSPVLGANGSSDPFSQNFINSCKTGSPSGTYTSIAAQGVLNGSVFQANIQSGEASWAKENYTISSPEPTDTPGPEDTSTPTSYTPTYIFTGSYVVKNTDGSVDTSSCFVGEATVNGSPIYGDNDANAIGFGLVLPPNGYDAQVVSSGKITAFTINNLSTNGGSGTFTLDNGETGSVSVNGGEIYQSPNYAEAAMRALRAAARYSHYTGK